MATAELEDILERHRRDPLQLLQILIELQAREGWLAPDTLSALAVALGMPRARVESTASFYSFLHTRPAGEDIDIAIDVTGSVAIGGKPVGVGDRVILRFFVETGQGVASEPPAP